MSYIRKDRNLERNSRRDIEGRLMEKVSYPPEDYVMRWSIEHKLLPEKGKQRVGAN
jgi:hypothetical protein